MNERRAVLAAVLLLAAAAVATAAETFTYSGDSMEATAAKGAERAVLTGHARVRSDDVLISADQIQLLGKDFTIALATGSVRVVDAKRGIDLSSNDLWYDRKAKIARIRGNAEMVDLKNEIVVKGGYLEDRDTEGLTIIQIGVRIFRKDMVCRSEFAKYWRDRKILELTGMPWVSRDGDEYRATKITINLDTEEIVLDGGVQGKMGVDDEPAAGEAPPAEAVPDEPPPAEAPPATTPPGGTAPVDGDPKAQVPGAR